MPNDWVLSLRVATNTSWFYRSCANIFTVIDLPNLLALHES